LLVIHYPAIAGPFLLFSMKLKQPDEKSDCGFYYIHIIKEVKYL